MHSRHPVRDGVEAVEKYVETLTLKAQQLPGAESMISTAKKVGSPLLTNLRRIGDPVVDAIDGGITKAANNGSAIYNTTTGMAKNGVEAGVQAAFNVTDRVLTPPPDERKQPHTLRGLVVHINNALRYLSATKLKPVFKGVDPYDVMLTLLSWMLFAAVLCYHLAITPWLMVRDRLAPMVLWAIGHKCEGHHGAPNGVHHAHDEHASDGGDAGEDASAAVSVNERNTGSGSNRSGGGGGSSNVGSGSGTGTRCSTGTGIATNTREASKSGTSGHGHHHGNTGGSKRSSSRSGTAKTNASNSHDEATT